MRETSTSRTMIGRGHVGADVSAARTTLRPCTGLLALVALVAAILVVTPTARGAPPSVRVWQPDGGEVWTGNGPHTIEWWMTDDASTALTVWINYSVDGGISWAPILGAQGIVRGLDNNSFAWSVPCVDTTSALVRVQAVDGNFEVGTGTSPAFFEIDCALPRVTKSVPNRGATDVDVNTTLAFEFSEGMNRTGTEASFNITPFVPGVFSWTGPNVQVDAGNPTAHSYYPDVAAFGGEVYVVWDWEHTDVLFAKSSDGGLTWSSPPIRISSDFTTASSGSPAIAVDAAGGLYVVWYDARSGDGDIYFARSTDGGATWTDPNVRISNSTAGQYDPTIAVDPAGTVYVAWQDYRAGGSLIYLARSTDGGATWTDPNVRISSFPSYQYSPAIAAGPAGEIDLAWADDRANVYGDVYFARSTDGGATWTDPNVQVSTGASTRVISGPTISPGGGGGVNLVWSDSRTGEPDVYFARSTDGGATWTDPNVRISSDLSGGYQDVPDLVAAPSGAIHAVWADRRNGNDDIYAAKSSDDGMTWTTNVRVDDDGTGQTQVDPTVAIDGKGVLHAVWWDMRGLGWDIYAARSLDGGASWGGPWTLLFDPERPLNRCTDYAATLRADLARDDSAPGNTLDGNADGVAQGSPVDDFALGFKTACTPSPPFRPPSVSVSSPKAGDFIGGGSYRTVGWTASDEDSPLDTLTFFVNYSGVAGAGTIAGPVRDSGPFYRVQWSVPLLDDQGVTVNVTAIDDTGLPAWAESGPFTVDSTRPNLSAYGPTGTNVPADTVVIAVFDEPLNATPDSLATAFGIREVPSGRWVAGTWVPIPANATFPTEFHLVPIRPLTVCAEYQVFVNATIVDRAGNLLAGPESWTFRISCGSQVPGDGGNLVPLFLISIALLALAPVLAVEVGRVAAMNVLLVPLQNRRRRGEEVEARGMIRGYILVHPGDCYTDIKRNLNLNDGTLTWHLAKLAKEGFIVSTVQGTRRRYYLRGVSVPPDNGGPLHHLQERILDSVVRDPGRPVRYLAEELGVSSSLALYHLRKLSQRRLVILERRGLRLVASPGNPPSQE